MSAKRQIIISTASVAAALGAIGTTHAQNGKLHIPSHSSFDQIAHDAISTSQAQAAIRYSAPRIAKTIKIDPSLNSAPYAEVAATIDDLFGFDMDTLLEGEGDLTEEEMQDIIDALGAEVPEGMTNEEYLDSIAEEIQDDLEDITGEEGLVDGVNQVVEGLLDDNLIDSTANGQAYFSCYGNCHSACHGSRGWR